MGRQALLLLLMSLAPVRQAWRPYLMVSSTMPLGIMLLPWLVGVPLAMAERLQIVAGSAVLAVAMTSVSLLAQRLAALRAAQAFHYYATLPVARVALLASVFLAFFAFALPGLALILLLGGAVYDLPIGGTWLLPLLALHLAATGLALAGLGAVIGLTARTEQVAAMLGNVAMMAVLFLGIIPPERMPEALRVALWVLPSTYAIEALKHYFSGTLGAGYLLASLAAVTAYAAALLALATRRLDWRSG